MFINTNVKISVGTGRNGNIFGYIIHCKQAINKRPQELISLTFFRPMDFEKETFLLNSDLLLIIEAGHRFNFNGCKPQMY